MSKLSKASSPLLFDKYFLIKCVSGGNAISLWEFNILCSKLVPDLPTPIIKINFLVFFIFQTKCIVFNIFTLI